MKTLPADTPVTRPVPSTVAIVLSEVFQVPSPVASFSCVVLPTQTLYVPVIGDTTGTALTVTVDVTAVLQPFTLTTV